AAVKGGSPPDGLDAAGRTIFAPSALAVLDAPGIAWEYLEQREAVISAAMAQRYDALCVMGGRVTQATLAADSQRLKLIARFGVGHDAIDVAACPRRGVMITITPDGVRRPVATTVITFVLALAQKLLVKDRLTRAGRWAEKLDHIGMGLTGRTLGAIGLGNIGAEVFRLAAP